MNVRARTLTVASGLFVLLTLAVYALGSVDRAMTEPSQFAGWTGQASIADQNDVAAMTPDDAVAVSLLAKAVRAAGGFAEAGVSLSLLATNYRVIRNASADAVVAARSSLAVDVIGDSGRTVARFWLDARTGLLLRKDGMAANGSVSSTHEFTSLDLVRPAFALAPTNADSWGSAVPAQQVTTLRQSGCDCPDVLPGNLSLLETHVSKHAVGGLDRAVHQVFSDGIAAVSLFFVSGSLASSDAQALTRIGFRPKSDTQSSIWIRPAQTSNDAWTAVWENDGRIVTAIVSGTTDDRRRLEMIVSAESPHMRVDDLSLVGRMIRGWQRLVGVLG